MTFVAFGGAEAENAGAPGSGVYAGQPNDSIIAAPAGFAGTYSYQIDPVNGVPVAETYGWNSPLDDNPAFMSIPFLFRFAAGFDDTVSVAELGQNSTAGNIARRLILTTDEKLEIVDADEDEIGSTAVNYVLAGSAYRMLWYVDLREPTMTRDILWVYKPAASVGPATDIAFVDGGAGADTITDVSSGFGVFSAGDIIVVSGSASNDGTYTIVSVVAGTITLATGTLTTEGAGASVTISHTAQWYKAIDVSAHGDGDPAEIEAITFGTKTGKGLPTSGGPFAVDEMCVQVLNKSPNTTAIGSITTVFKVPKANGADSDFNTGTGTNPDFNDVDEIPPDGVTTYDEGDVVGDQQSYEPNDATASDTPLAIQVVGQGARAGGATATIRNYILEGGTRDYSPQWTTVGVGYRILRAATAAMKTWNEVNGQTITESLFNTIEVGMELDSLPSAATFRLSQIGPEYMKEGPIALPSDFPTAGVATIVPGSMGVALGSANVGLF